MNKPTNQERSLNAFMQAKAEFDRLLAELQQASANHFDADPDAVLWGEAEHLADWNRRLRDMADQHYRRGDYAPGA